MLSNFLVKRFVKNSENVSDVKVRESYANLAGIIGIITIYASYYIMLI